MQICQLVMSSKFSSRMLNPPSLLQSLSLRLRLQSAEPQPAALDSVSYRASPQHNTSSIPALIYSGTAAAAAATLAPIPNNQDRTHNCWWQPQAVPRPSAHSLHRRTCWATGRDIKGRWRRLQSCAYTHAYREREREFLHPFDPPTTNFWSLLEFFLVYYYSINKFTCSLFMTFRAPSL